jgi:hypothetical protein
VGVPDPAERHTLDPTRGYMFWSGVIGGAFLTTVAHGTDQMMVQRYLCSRNGRDARTALLTSGAVVLAQFVLFLVMLAVKLLTAVSWQWHVLIGSLVTLGLGALASTVSRTPANGGGRRHG